MTQSKRSSKRHKTIYKGVFFREHTERKHNGKPDAYFTIMYRIDGRLREEGIGWASDGWNAKKASGLREELKVAQRTGGPGRTLAERRQIAKDREEAKRAKEQQEARDSLTFGHVFEKHYFPQAKADKSPRSHKREQSLFQLWIDPVLGDLPIKKIAPLDVERVKKKMTDAGKSPRSIQYCLAVIRQTFNFARNHDLFEGESPTRKVKFPRCNNRRLRFLTPAEANRLLEALKEVSWDLYEMALLSLHCALRAGEIFKLTWSDIDFENRVLILRDTKSGSTEQPPMSDGVYEMLSKKKRGKPDQLVFPARNGKKRVAISRVFRGVVQDLGLNDNIPLDDSGKPDRRYKVVFHSLRHSAASWLVQGGENLYTVKELLGHRDLSTSERYSHLDNQTLRGAVSKIDDLLKSQSAEANGKTGPQEVKQGL